MSSAFRRITCRYHAEAPALGVCMRCRSPVCAGCRTRLRGINLCHRCLNRLAQPAEAASAVGGASIVGSLFLVIPALALLGLIFWWLGGPAAADTTSTKPVTAVTRVPQRP